MLYIDSNLTPSEAVSKYPELQVCQEIAKWANDSEKLQMYLSALDEILDDKDLSSAKKVKDAILDVMYNQVGRSKGGR